MLVGSFELCILLPCILSPGHSLTMQKWPNFLAALQDKFNILLTFTLAHHHMCCVIILLFIFGKSVALPVACDVKQINAR